MSEVGGISFGGLASGLPADIVDRLMEVQKTRLNKLLDKRDAYTTQKSKYTDLLGKLRALQTKAVEMQTASTSSPHTATSSDENVLTVAASSTAQAATHAITVTNLATNQSTASGGNVATSTDTLVGAETVDFSYNGNAYSVALAGGDKLDTIATKINNAYRSQRPAGTTEAGVSASVLYDGTKYQLVLNAGDSGTNSGAQRITGLTTNGGLNFTSGAAINDVDGFNVNTVTAVDANLIVDGVGVSSQSNTVSNVISGVTLNLKSAGNANAQVTNDATALKDKVNEFTTAVNDVIGFLNDNTEFKGDFTARGVISQIRGVVGTATTVTGAYSSLAQLGIKTDRYTGQLSMDSAAFDKAISNDFGSVAEVFSNTGDGLGFRMEDMMDSMTDFLSGTVKGREKSFDSRISFMDDRITREEERLQSTRVRLTLKFANLEQMMSQLQSSGNALSGLTTNFFAR
jgi:flagellar hook-associated protein 2